MTGKRTQFALTASAIALVVSPALAGNERVRTAGASMAVTPADTTVTRKMDVTAQPKSFAEYAEALKQGLVSGPPPQGRPSVLQAPRVTGSKSGMLKKGAGQDVDPLPALPCGTYTDAVAFDTDHGPFSRALGNFEDFELANAPAGFLCITDDAQNPDLDCQQHLDTLFGGVCADLNDLLNGLAIDNTPSRGATWWEIIVGGAGFVPGSSKFVMVNYFGDTLDLTFPNPGPAACAPGAAATNPPNVWGSNIFHRTSTDNGTIKVDLASGESVTFDTGPLSSTYSFFGVCCTSDIVAVHMTDTGSGGNAINIDNARWGDSAGVCSPDTAPATLDLIYAGLECLEEKLDTLEFPTGGGGSAS
jgi:hypothetical protein